MNNPVIGACWVRKDLRVLLDFSLPDKPVKGDILSFFFFFFFFLPLCVPFSVFYRCLCMWKILKVRKPKVRASGSSSSEVSECHVSSPAFNCVTSHYITVSHICISYTYIHSRCESRWKLKTGQNWPETQWAELAQACVSWPIRGPLGIRGGGSH